MQLKFQKKLKHLSGALIAALLLISSGSSFAEGLASSDAVTGYVTATSADGDVKRIKTGDELEDGDVVTTGENSSVSIFLANGEVVNLGPLSNYTVGAEQVSGSDGSGFAKRSLNSKSPTLSTATSAGGGVSTPATPAPTTPPTSGSPM